MQNSDTPVSYRRRGEEGTLSLRGTIDIFEAVTLRDAARRALDDPKAATVRVSLAGAERLDVSAFQILCGLRRDVEAAGRAFVAEAPPAGAALGWEKIGCAL